MKITQMFFPLFFSFLFPIQLFAACNLGISASNVSWDGSGGGTYGVFDATEYVQAVNFNVTHDASDACDLFVTFSKGGSASYSRILTLGGDTLSYQIYDTSSKTNILKGIDDVVTSNDALTGAIIATDTSPKVMTYHLVMDTGQIKPPGTYQDTFAVKVFEGTVGSTTTEDASTNVTFSAVVPSIAQLSLVDTGGAFNELDEDQALDFGTFQANESMSFDMKIRTNAGYSITFTSDNAGEMVHSNPAVGSVVDYTLKVDNVAKDLSSAIVVATGSGVTTSSGTNHVVTIVLGADTAQFAGTYSDHITVTYVTTE